MFSARSAAAPRRRAEPDGGVLGAQALILGASKQLHETAAAAGRACRAAPAVRWLMEGLSRP